MTFEEFQSTLRDADAAMFERVDVRRNWDSEMSTEPPDDPDKMVEEYLAKSLKPTKIGALMGRYKAGEYVKVEVRDETSRESEWMWVKVENSA
jgi:hypothetical protein